MTTKAQRQEKVAGQLHGAIYALVVVGGWTAEQIREEVESAIKDGEADRDGSE